MTRWFFPSAVFIVSLLSAAHLNALAPLSSAQLKDSYAQTGLSMAANDVTLYSYYDSIKIRSVEHRNPFGQETLLINEYFMLDDFELLGRFGGQAEIDVGIYRSPDEQYTVVDTAKVKNHVAVFVKPKIPRRYNKRTFYSDSTSTSVLQDEIYKFSLNSEQLSPVEGYGAIRLALSHVSTHLELDFTLGAHCAGPYNLSESFSLAKIDVSGFAMHDMVRDNVTLPGSVMTLYPEGSGINMELRTRLSVGEVNVNNLTDPDNDSALSSGLKISGIHLGEVFSTEVPEHLGDTGSVPENHEDVFVPPLDTSAWGSDFDEDMYSGYFLVGNLNQVDFNDDINTFRLYHRNILGADTGARVSPNGNDMGPLVGLVANPLSINFGVANDNGDPTIRISTGLTGSLRIASLTAWEEVTEGDGPPTIKEYPLGAIAVDGIRIKHCVIEFPGGYINEEGHLAGTLDPGQLSWLEEPPAPPDYSVEDILKHINPKYLD